jgi:hypothetical protein
VLDDGYQRRILMTVPSNTVEIDRALKAKHRTMWAAAQAGASVVACDLTPELFDAGRDLAGRHGVDVGWREADAEALPFADGEFDRPHSHLLKVLIHTRPRGARNACDPDDPAVVWML